ncbi:tRNA lysidine(34) synthetase TilS [Sphingomonas sp. CJ20]
MTALPEAAVARFRQDMLVLAPEAAAPDWRLGLAVSGGADSMAMLVLARAAFPGQVAAATVDHQLRAAAAAEAAMVARHCAVLGIPHATLLPDAPIMGASIQAQARAARYRLLAHWAGTHGISALATAHHADDQAETFLMRAARGSGVTGLSGIRARAVLAEGPPAVALLRPLLGCRAAALRALAHATGTPFVDDPSNADPRHDRTRFRQMLAANPDLDVMGLAASAAFAVEAEAALAALADRYWSDNAQIARDAVRLALHAPATRDTLRRLARRGIGETRRILAIAEPAWSDSANVEPLLDALAEGKSATQAGVLVSPAYNIWDFRGAPPRRSH